MFGLRHGIGRAMGGVVMTAAIVSGCGAKDSPDTGASGGAPAPDSDVYVAGSFGDDLAFLSRHTDAITLADEDGKAQIIVVPAYQGRVMTSTTGGMNGPSFGWINRELIASGETLPHMNPYGGEDRFWLGPEGGQFALFFPKDAPFEFEHWQTPAIIDTEPFETVARTDRSAVFLKEATLENYSGTQFTFKVVRTVKLLKPADAWGELGVDAVDGVDLVAYETSNALENTGDEAWTKETGLLSIWILGMYKPSPETTIVIPIEPGDDGDLGLKVNDTYFGKVPEDRLIVHEDKLFFRGDGEYRSKIGISPRRAKPIAGSYDAAGSVLTLVQYNQRKGQTDYVNSMWELQDEPYGGDVVNSYNDGPPEPGAEAMGPFYELETSSPAAALAPGEIIVHVHRTFHFQGGEAALDRIAQGALGVPLAEIRAAFAQR